MEKANKSRIILLLILILSVFLRLFYLGRIPDGFYSDEAAYGYNAYSILQTGRDEYGNFFPMSFKSFGDYKTPLYIYFLVPFVKIFGLSEFSIRLGSAVLGIGSIVLIYLLAEKLFQKRAISLLITFLASISPFNLQFNRMSHENNLVVFLVLAGLYFFYISLEKHKFILFSLISFTLSIYAYHDARIFIPLFVLSLFIIYRRQLAMFKRYIIFGLLFSFVLLLPFIQLIKTDAFWSRPKFTIISSDVGIALRINEERGEDAKYAYFLPEIFHNKVISYLQTFADNYMKHLSFDFLFLKGDPVKIYNTVGNGIAYLITFPFIIYGFYVIFNKDFTHKWLIFAWLVLAPIPSALTRFVPSASRIFSLSPLLSILAALGMFTVIRHTGKKKSLKLILMIITSCLFVANIAYYLHFYYVNSRIRYAKEWHYGTREVLSQVENMQDSYGKIWFSKNVWGYIYPLFYLHYPPAAYQRQAKLSNLNEFGFGWVEGFDKYVFRDIPNDNNLLPNTLYIGTPSDFKHLKKPIHTIYYPDGQVAFYLADINSF